MANRSRSFVFLAAVAMVVATWCAPGLTAQAPPQRVVEPGSQAQVQGTVMDHLTGDPVAGATVSLGAGPSGTRGRGTRVSDEDGAFLFEDVPEGSYRISVTAVAYKEMNDTIQVSADEDLRLILPLSADPIDLDPIVVTTRRTQDPMRDHARRTRAGGSGFVITREEIDEKRPRLLSELLHRVPGGMVVPTPPHGYSLLLRGQCRPGIWVDGVSTGARSIDQLMSPHDVEAIEVYQGFELPVEFGVDPCGGILIWTRQGPRQTYENAPDGASTSGILGDFLRVALLVLVVGAVIR